MLPLQGALAVITGAGSGIGAALAKALAARGTNLALVDIDAEGLEETRQSLGADVRASGHQMDVTNGAAIATLPAIVHAAHGAPADILVNNAGVALQGSFAEATQTDFDWLLGIEKRRKRILIGRDARTIDILQRLLPASYWPIVRKQFQWGRPPISMPMLATFRCRLCFMEIGAGSV